MKPVIAPSDARAALNAILRASPRLMRVLAVARDLDLPDWLIVSGAIYQTVWNSLTGRAPDHGIKDYDLFYFDGADLSYDGEDLHIRRAAALYPLDLAPLVEVRNQARVHLWFEARFGEAYAPLSSTDEALSRFVAPFGLEDLFAMRLRPNPSRGLAKGWDKVIASARARWPELTVQR